MRLFTRTLLAAAAFVGAALVGFSAELKVGVIDLQKAVSQSDAGREAAEKLRLRVKQYQDEITTRSNSLNKLREEIEKEVKGLKQGQPIPQATLEKDRSYSSQARELQRLLGGYQEEAKVYEKELTNKVLEKLSPVLTNFATVGQYDLILRAGDQVVFTSTKQDITDAVIATFNKALKK